MASFSITAAWEETHAFVMREGGLLFPVAIALFALPAAAIELVVPAQRGPVGQFAPWQLWMIPYALVTVLASLALTRLALGGQVSVREALRESAVRLPVAIGASLLIALAAILALMPAMVLAAIARTNPAYMVLARVYVIVMIVGFLFVTVRLLMLNAVIMAERVGVTKALRRSFALGKGHHWRLLGFFLLFAVVSGFVAVAVSIAGGSVLLALAKLTGDEQLGRMLLALVGGVLNAVLTIYLVTMLVAIYRQLAGSSRGM